MAFDEATRETGSRSPATVKDWEDRLECWTQIVAVSSRLDAKVFADDLTALADALSPASSWMRRLTARVFSRRYRRARRALRERIRTGKIPDRDLLDLCRLAMTAQESWSALGAPGLPSGPPARTGELPLLIGRAGQFLATVAELTQEPVDDDLTETSARLNELLRDRATLVKLPRIHELIGELRSAGLADLIVELEDRDASGEEAATIFYTAWAQSILDDLAFADRVVGAFDGDAHDQAVGRFREQDSRRLKSVPSSIRRIWAEGATDARDSSRDQAQLLAKQAGLKQRHIPVRDLVAQTSDVLLAVQPCWAMSPLMVSQLLPARTQFDVVIFDEASQITPADAVTSIFRGRQLVIAGDERQLPPSPFFVAETGEDQAEDEHFEEELSLNQQLAGTAGFESVLDALLPMLPFRWLQWHYRSEDERLIAFSNAHIYDRVLITFPGTGGDTCLSCSSVDLISEETNSPSAEVDAVVQLILEHAAERPDESLGVIAMGIKHAMRTDESLRAALKSRPDLEPFFAEDVEEPFFIKNLERVQGDERDAMILTIGYGKNSAGQLVYRFGPLLTDGGERRLNVAVTRAKKRMTLVSSFSSMDMDPNKLNSEGMRLLRQYVQYMEQGGTTLGDVITQKPALNPFEIDVRDTLTSRGLHLLPQYGVSGYRIDFAVAHPSQPGRMLLAIECDGASYHSSGSARERDRLRQEHLERLGWRFHRIWSSEWFASKESAVTKALAAYENALTQDGRPSRVPPHAPIAELGRVDPPSRRGSRPRFALGYSITEYGPRTLEAIVDWIESDGVVRTKDEVVGEVMIEMGFERRGKNIVAAISEAIERARGKR